MNVKKLVSLLAAAFAASVSFGQSAELKADKSSASAGAEITLTASVTYAGTPSAMGWSVKLPEGWSYVSTSGPDVPTIAPQPGSTGTLEWAYTDAPAGVAHFRFTIKATGKAGDAQVKSAVLLRAEGKQTTLEVAPVAIAVSR